MKKITFLCFLVVSVIFAGEKNPLIKKEINPISNPSFEENLKDWGGSPKNNYMERTSYGSVVCKIANTGYKSKKSLCRILPEYKASYIPRSFKLEVGKKYYVSAKIKTEGNVWGNIRVVYGARGEPTSSSVGPDTDWKEAGVTFVGTKKGQPEGADPSIAFCEIRLQAQGEGKVYFDDIRVYELKDYSPCLRVKLIKPEGIKYRIRLYSKVGPPRWFFSKYYFTKEGIKSGEYSEWINLGEENDFKGRGIASTGIHFQDLRGKKFDKIKAEIEIAYAADEKAVLKRFIREVEGNIIGVFIPKSENTPFYFVDNIKLLIDDIEKREKFLKSLNLPPVNLKHFYIEAHLKGYGSFYSDPEIIEREVNVIKTIGFNALDTQYSGLAKPFREKAEKAGIEQTHQTMRNFKLPYNKKTKKFILDWDKIRENIELAVKNWIETLKRHDEEQIEPIKFVDIGDEIAGFVFDGEEYNQGYRKYLKNQGLKPSFFGKDFWIEVEPAGIWNWRQTRKNRPKDRSNIFACRNYYWTLRYWNYVNSEIYRIMTETLEKYLPGRTTRVNFGPPWFYEYCSYLRGAEIWEFARNRSISSMWNEDWLNTSGWRQSGIQLCAYLVDLSRSCAEERNLETDAYVMPEGRKNNIQLKLSSVIGKGAKKIDVYRYGPGYASPDSWSDSLSMTEGVARFLRKLEKAEEILYEGKVPEPDTGIIWSQSNDVWRNTGATVYDRQLIYLALLHKQIPIKFVDETGIEKGNLNNYKVVYMNAEYLKKEAQEKLAEWVKEGGNLWVDGVAGTGDEYGQKTDKLLPLYGIKIEKIVRSESKGFNPQYYIPREKPLEKIKIKETGEEIDAIGIKVKFSLTDPENTEIIGEYEDGTPAIVKHKFGKGNVYYVGTYAGLVYSRPVKRIRGKIETGYREKERKIITDFALKNQVKRPVECDIPCVEADLLESEKGIGLVLANYTGSPLKEINIKVNTHRKIRSVYSATKGKIMFKKGNGYIKFKIPLEVVDLITLK